MLNFLALLSIPLIFLADYLAVVYWLLATTPPQLDRPMQFSMRTLLVATTVIAIHCGCFAAFLSAT